MATQEQQQAIDICNAQFAIDHHPDASPFWDSQRGQNVLDTVRANSLTATTTNSYRCRWHAEQMSQVAA
jgi:hypothetical protein